MVCYKVELCACVCVCWDLVTVMRVSYSHACKAEVHRFKSQWVLAYSTELAPKWFLHFSWGLGVFYSG